jgi:hypothetical protein
MYYIGLDVHKKTISYCVKDASGRVQQEGIHALGMGFNPAVNDCGERIDIAILSDGGCGVGTLAGRKTDTQWKNNPCAGHGANTPARRYRWGRAILNTVGSQLLKR